MKKITKITAFIIVRLILFKYFFQMWSEFFFAVSKLSLALKSAKKTFFVHKIKLKYKFLC